MNQFIEESFKNLKLEPDTGSFRDPCGQVFKVSTPKGLKIIRGVNKKTFEDQRALFSEGFFQNFVKKGKVIESSILDSNLFNDHEISKNWPYFLEHKAINLITYPYEWTFGQLKDAAILHLELLKTSLENNWIIKDSSPFNVQYISNKPIFIDTPSFARWEEGEGWSSYRQFCMMFLYPLMLESYFDLDFRILLRSNLDGIDPKFIFKILGVKSLLKKGVISHVLLPYIVERNILKKEKNTAISKKRIHIKHSKLSVIALVDSMLRTIKSLETKSNLSAWSDYDHENTYEKKDNDVKRNFINKITKDKSYKSVWDCGANTGLFSEHIENNVNQIVAMDSDPIAIEKMYQRLKNKNSNINPLVMRLENMSPDQGFYSSERTKLEARSKPNLVMCLALIHHIRISSNIPCDIFLNYLKSLNSEIIIEFVNREDEMVEKLMMNKKEKYDDYNQEAFETSVLNYFSIKTTEVLKGGLRKLYHLIPK